jgi:hypothetical protein
MYCCGDFDVCYSAVEAAVFEAVAAVGLLVQQLAVPATMYITLSYRTRNFIIQQSEGVNLCTCS